MPLASTRTALLVLALAGLTVHSGCNTVRDVGATQLAPSSGTDLDAAGDGGPWEDVRVEDTASDVDRPDLDAAAPDAPDAPDASDGSDVAVDLPEDVGDLADDDPDVEIPDVSDEPDAPQDVGVDVGPDVAPDVADDPDAPPDLPGPIALYTFDNGSGATVSDRSGISPRVDLTLTGATRWVNGRDAVATVGYGSLNSADPAVKLQDRIVASGEFTVEVWTRSARTTQRGPSRIVSYSWDSSDRNFTLGQDGTDVSWRVRSESNTDNGTPGFTAGAVATDLTHLVLTQAADFSIYKDSVRVGGDSVGAIARWDPGHFLMLANERSARRPFIGELYQVAIYDRALSADEIAARFDAGPDGTGPDTRPRVSFASFTTSAVEGESVSVGLTATPAPSAPLEVEYVVDRGEDDIAGLTGTVTIGTNGLGTIDLEVIDDDSSEGPESAVLVLLSGADYTSAGTVITEIRIEDPDFLGPGDPLLWFSADAHGRVTGEPVLNWPDVTGSGPSASATGEPYYDPTGMGSEASVVFRDGGDYFDLGNGYRDWTAGVTAFVVARPTSVAADGFLFDFSTSPTDDQIGMKRDGDTCDLVYQVSDAASQNDLLTVADALCIDGGAVFSVRQAGGVEGELTETMVYVDAAAAATGLLPVPTDVLRTENFLGNGAGTADERFQGHIAEVIIYDTALSDADVAAVHDYLMAKYYPER
jgi:hypothetical protein